MKIEYIDEEFQEKLRKVNEDFQEEVSKLVKKLWESFINEFSEKKDEWPKEGDEYWTHNGFGMKLKCEWYNSEVDKGTLKLGNVYRTEEDAEKALLKQKARAKLQRIADRYDECDWETPAKDKYHLYFNDGDWLLGSNHISKFQGTIYFSSKPDIDEIEKEMGDLMEYL